MSALIFTIETPPSGAVLSFQGAPSRQSFQGIPFVHEGPDPEMKTPVPGSSFETRRLRAGGGVGCSHREGWGGPGLGKVNYGFGWAVHILPYGPGPPGSRLRRLY
jgi:hypothetical protein